MTIATELPPFPWFNPPRAPKKEIKMATAPITFTYLNHRGETEERKVEVDSVEFHRNPGYGYQPGWFISGFDLERVARRSFALSRVILPEEQTKNVVFRLMGLK